MSFQLIEILEDVPDSYLKKRKTYGILHNNEIILTYKHKEDAEQTYAYLTKKTRLKQGRLTTVPSLSTTKFCIDDTKTNNEIKFNLIKQLCKDECVVTESKVSPIGHHQNKRVVTIIEWCDDD